MKKLLKVFTVVAVLIVALGIITWVRGDAYLFKALWACYLHGETGPTIHDARFFASNRVAASTTAWDWPLHADYNKQALPATLQSTLDETGTAAFLIIRDDSILYERYSDEESKQALTNSFSVAKSITTMLAQIAIQKGFLTGWNQKVNTVLPELKGEYANELELWHLSTMSAGLDWDEEYKNPWGITAEAYYTGDISTLMLSVPVSNEPGKSFNYQSGATQLLALTLIKATGKSLSELASEWLWKPMQSNHAATWHSDDHGIELAYCCFNTNARNFARFGKLMLHHGKWNETRILDSAFVHLATTPVLSPEYGYSFWLDNSQGTDVFFQWGFHGQYIITIPDYNIVVVRLGNSDLVDNNHMSEYCRIITREVLKMAKS